MSDDQTTITARIEMGDDRVTPECAASLRMQDRPVTLVLALDQTKPIGRGRITGATATDDGRALVLNLSVDPRTTDLVDKLLGDDARAYSLGFTAERREKIEATGANRFRRITVHEVGVRPALLPKAIPRERDPKAGPLANFIGGMRAQYLIEAKRVDLEPAAFGFALAGLAITRLRLYRAARRGDTAAAVRYATLLVLGNQSLRERRARAAE